MRDIRSALRHFPWKPVPWALGLAIVFGIWQFCWSMGWISPLFFSGPSAIAKRFVQLHGGRIWAESELGQGSTLTVVLPLREENLPNTERADISRISSGALERQAG